LAKEVVGGFVALFFGGDTRRRVSKVWQALIVRRTEDQETKWQGVGCHSASQGEKSRVEGFAFRDFRIRTETHFFRGGRELNVGQKHRLLYPSEFVKLPWKFLKESELRKWKLCNTITSKRRLGKTKIYMGY